MVKTLEKFESEIFWQFWKQLLLRLFIPTQLLNIEKLKIGKYFLF